ncbi:hypothetical protein [Mesorhizobium sp. IMUNJ 23232]|uniref:hypothetical protein n=1 Tax=Mesorhizobium sp. IMUNJ 23232 TaxID=3376064 RepID=UPI0037BD4A3F
MDPDDHHLFASLGCAAENLRIAAAVRARSADMRFDATGEGSVVFDFGSARAAPSVMFDAIPQRQSTRADYDGRPVGSGDLQALAAAARIPGVDVILLTDRRQIERVLDLVIAGNSAQMADPAFVRELKQWLRFSQRNAVFTSSVFSTTYPCTRQAGAVHTASGSKPSSATSTPVRNASASPSKATGIIRKPRCASQGKAPRRPETVLRPGQRRDSL